MADDADEVMLNADGTPMTAKQRRAARRASIQVLPSDVNFCKKTAKPAVLANNDANDDGGAPMTAKERRIAKRLMLQPNAAQIDAPKQAPPNKKV